MANSKSNIYPIQLQGAELCLNCYDAEIKQYRGFNKNNSPFVGGCLSNVFTREEQIEDGNAETIYIDNQNNIYKVDEEGIYINDVKVKSFPAGTKFYKNEQIIINDKVDIVKVFNEDVYIYQSGLELKGHCFEQEFSLLNWNSGELGYKPFFKFVCDIQKYNDKYIFTAKYISGNQFVNNGATGYGKIIIIENDIIKVNAAQTYTNIDISDYTNFKVMPPSVFCFEGGCIFAPNNKIIASVSDSHSNYVYIDFTSYILTSLSDFTSSDTMLTSKTRDYFMTNTGKCYLINCNVNTNPNSVTISGVIKYSSGTLTLYRANAISANLGSYIYRCSVFNGLAKNWFFSGVQNLYQLNSDSSYVKTFPAESIDMLFTPFLGHTVNSQSRNIFDINTGSYVCVGNFKVLMYDNQVIGISVIDQSTKVDYAKYIGTSNKILSSVGSGVLVTEWNSVDENSIILIDNDTIVYKNINDGLFYRITVDTPKLYIKLNQLVVNAAIIENSLRLEDRKTLTFASDWNCNYLLSWGNGPGYFISNVNTKYFIASAINEYDQKENASLILNQKEVVRVDYSNASTYPSGVQEFFPLLLGIQIPKCSKINFYMSLSSSGGSAAYVCSYENEKVFFDDNLNKLLFPNNTDGNVQYNPDLFSEFISSFGVNVFVKSKKNVYQLIKEENVYPIMSYFLGTLTENFEDIFIIQGQYYGVISEVLFAINYSQGVVAGITPIVSVKGLQYCGNTPYEALFFSKTNRCLYSFSGANVLNQKQLVDKISIVKAYKYNPATQSIFLLTDIGVIVSSLFGIYMIDMPEAENIYLLNNGVILCDNAGHYRYIKYYLDEEDEGYTKQNINVETSFYGMNNEVVTINDCLYFRIFSEEHEEGDLKVSATTISLSGRKTEETTFKIKASDWDKITHTIYLRYQPKAQRGLGVAFAIDSPFKISSLSVGSQPDAVLVDKVSKGAITAPSVTTNNNEW